MDSGYYEVAVVDDAYSLLLSIPLNGFKKIIQPFTRRGKDNLSIPLNGFLKAEEKKIRDKGRAFNSIEWIPE